VTELPDAFHIDTARLRASFERASHSYESAAALQARVAAELLERLAAFRFAPRVVLDLGAGTGRVTRELKRRYPRALVIALDVAPGMLREARRHLRPWRRFARVCGDALRLPLKDASVDFVYSNLLLQWCDPLGAALAEVRRVLRPGGFFAFSSLGPDTLGELRSAWAAVDGGSHVSAFLDMHDVGDALAQGGFAEPVLDIERVTLTYDSVLGLVRELKQLGAQNETAARTRGLTGKSRWRAMEAAYERFRCQGRLPATYEVVYGAAWAASGRTAGATAAGEVRIDASRIARRERG
jgi:malonyl-CoA O-methyltransferase